MGLEPVTAAILAGGLGTRLSPVLPGLPKVLADVGGRPFITYLLNQIEENGIKDVVLCTGHRAEQVEEKLGSAFGSVRLHYSKEQAPMGTGGALRLALPLLSYPIILVMNGDSFVEFKLAPFLERHLSEEAALSILLVEVEDTVRYGRVNVDVEGCITGFSEKAGSRGPGLINAGVYLMTKKTVAGISEGEAVSLERDIFPQLVGKGLYGFPCNGEFIDIGTPESYIAAQSFFNMEGT